jgi:hypothetical protein
MARNPNPCSCKQDWSWAILERPCPQIPHDYPALQSLVVERQMLKPCDCGLTWLLSRRLGVACGIVEVTQGLAWRVASLKSHKDWCGVCCATDFTVLKICVFHVCTAMFSARQDHNKQVGIVCVTAYVYMRKTGKYHRRKCILWMRRWLLQRYEFSHLQLLRELRENNPDDFRN